MPELRISADCFVTTLKHEAAGREHVRVIDVVEQRRFQVRPVVRRVATWRRLASGVVTSRVLGLLSRRTCVERRR